MPRSETAPVRPGEELDEAALSAYLDARLEGGVDRLRVEQFPGGHSNLTYLIQTSQAEYVLRRAPLGPVAPKAHDMVREYGVLKAVHEAFPEAPRVEHLCEDAGVLGAPFFLMERRHGVILRDSVPEAVASQPDYARRVSEGFVDCLARLHRIDARRGPLAALGKPDGFLERQIRGWSERWARARTGELRAMDELAEWLARRRPDSQGPVIVHNDYKLDNLMLDAADCGRVAAVLDWEMATVGDPLVDLGMALCYWAPPADTGAVRCLSRGPGWFTAQEVIERYAAGTGFDVSNAGYYHVFGVFKLAVIIQQIYYRYHVGQTRDERFRGFGERARALAEAGREMAERG